MGGGTKWDEYQPIRLLPGKISNAFSKQAQYLYDDLAANKLHVVLVPAPAPMHYGHMVRRVETLNPEWYSALYAENPHFRRDRSFSALERIIDKTDGAFTDANCGIVSYKFHYDRVYRKLIYQRLTQGYSVQGHDIEPNEVILAYFGLKVKRGRKDKEEEVPF